MEPVLICQAMVWNQQAQTYQLRLPDQEGIKTQTMLSQPGLGSWVLVAQVDTGVGPERRGIYVAVMWPSLLPLIFIFIYF